MQGSVYNDPEDPMNPGFAKYPSKGTIRNDMGAYGGPLRRILSNSPIGIRTTDTQLPSRYVLHQNYPNPFNPTTKIKFELPKSAFTKIFIYDVLGREVADLVNKQLKQGTYEVEWYAVSFSSGVYFYELVTDNYTETKKMVLVK
jgi:hypothetical protein